jgi:Zn-finger nucleic acid-binding protein
MYRSSPEALTCPQCAVALTLVPPPAAGDVALFTCAQCGGAWFDAQASMAVLQGKIDPSEVQRRSKPPAPRSGPERSRPCARCSDAMLPYPYGEVMLDTCPAHGTWFDHDEIERVVKAARKAAEEPLELPSGADIWATAKFTVGMIVVPIGALLGALGSVVTNTDRDDRDDDDFY